jgi:Zn-dependent M28 family amino/carboxypeptidase
MRHWKQGKIDSYINFDMVSRYNPKDSANYLTVNLPKGQIKFQESLTKLNSTGPGALEIRYVYEAEEDYGDSDYAPFAVRKIPFIWFFTGLHDDYHEESDTFDKANIKDMTRIVDLGFRMVLERAGRVE